MKQNCSYFSSNKVLFVENNADVISNEKKETDSPANEGFFSKLGKWLEIICSPSKKKDD